VGDVGEGAVNVRYVGLALQSSAIEEKGKKKKKKKKKTKMLNVRMWALRCRAEGLVVKD
jgi:hypothetical protein